MNATQRYLDAVSLKLGGVSDYRIAQELGETRQRISSYRTGTTNFNPHACFQVAKILGLDERAVLAAVEVDRAKTEKERDFWKKWGKRAANNAAPFIIGASILLGALSPENARAFNQLPVGRSADINIH